MKTTALILKAQDRIQQPLEDGVLYYSRKYGIAIHLCACGCKVETVTPVSENPKDWQLKETDPEGPTLEGSIGNFQMPCKSHYWVRNGQIVWC